MFLPQGDLMRLVALLAWLILTAACAEARVGLSSLGRLPQSIARAIHRYQFLLPLSNILGPSIGG
jgi:hypothetical protein